MMARRMSMQFIVPSSAIFPVPFSLFTEVKVEQIRFLNELEKMDKKTEKSRGNGRGQERNSRDICINFSKVLK